MAVAVDGDIQPHEAGIFRRSHRLPLKRQPPWALEKQDKVTNSLAKERQSPGAQGEDTLEGTLRKGVGPRAGQQDKEVVQQDTAGEGGAKRTLGLLTC